MRVCDGRMEGVGILLGVFTRGEEGRGKRIVTHEMQYMSHVLFCSLLIYIFGVFGVCSTDL